MGVMGMIEVGSTATMSKICTDADLVGFAELTLDTNPLHLDQSYAEASRFGQRIAHGMWVAGLLSAVLGTRLPGPGSVYLSQTLKFLAPVHVGDTVTAFAEVAAVGPGQKVGMLTWCTNQDGTRVIEGEALLLAPATTVDGALSPTTA